MGMFDDIVCEFRMPDGHDGFYQSKDLDCLCDSYNVNAQGRLIRTRTGGWNDEDRNRPVGDMNYSGSLHIYDLRHRYDLEFVNGCLATIYCHQTHGKMLFEPQAPIKQEVALEVTERLTMKKAAWWDLAGMAITLDKRLFFVLPMLAIIGFFGSKFL